MKLSRKSVFTAILLPTMVLGPLAALAEPQQPQSAQQIRISAAERGRSGIGTAVAVAADSATAAHAGANDLALAGTVVAPPALLAVASTAYAGVVQQLHASSLQTVRQGAPLLTMHSQAWLEVQRDYLQAATQAALADARAQRDTALHADGIIAAARLEESRSAAMLARLAADERAQALRAGGWDSRAIEALLRSRALTPELVLRAPRAGTVLELVAEPGARLEAGMPVARISRSGALWIELQASRAQAERLRVGEVLQVQGCGSARVIAVGSAVNTANQSVPVRAEQMGSGDCLKLNAYVEARMAPGSKTAGAPAQGVLVPAAALVRRGADTFVFVQNAGGFMATPVQAVQAGADLVRVSGKVAAGDAVAVKGLVVLKGSWAGLGNEAAAPAAATAGSAAGSAAASAGAK
ncbi:HlyD family efflux transporter periplasmic adaptor subunit [Pseudoduganella sp. FT93W]|uniref:HlyD family efflux transporter periplasmic adaptor subunit n=1 Tax=Duganella fentianensis TaxID=2692177 RepID=A0A845HWU9_9BURK|nr:efflux RND transporter periplasmic adaptor subunit [Duganella fentianensis]MYN45874.1 HlyD family efflux transporter periplasmic adaptor subunit [Duganella fentianensis]